MPLSLWSQTLWILGPGGTGVSLYEQYQKPACTCVYIYAYVYVYT